MRPSLKADQSQARPVALSEGAATTCLNTSSRCSPPAGAEAGECTRMGEGVAVQADFLRCVLREVKHGLRPCTRNLGAALVHQHTLLAWVSLVTPPPGMGDEAPR